MQAQSSSFSSSLSNYKSVAAVVRAVPSNYVPLCRPPTNLQTKRTDQHSLAHAARRASSQSGRVRSKHLFLNQHIQISSEWMCLHMHKLGKGSCCISCDSSGTGTIIRDSVGSLCMTARGFNKSAGGKWYRTAAGTPGFWLPVWAQYAEKTWCQFWGSSVSVQIFSSRDVNHSTGWIPKRWIIYTPKHGNIQSGLGF